MEEKKKAVKTSSAKKLPAKKSPEKKPVQKRKPAGKKPTPTHRIKQTKKRSNRPRARSKKSNVETVQSETHALIKDVILPRPLPVRPTTVQFLPAETAVSTAHPQTKTQAASKLARPHTLRQELIGLAAVTAVGVALFVLMSSAYISTIAEIEGTEITSQLIQPYQLAERSFHTPIGQVDFVYPDDYGVIGVGAEKMTLGAVDATVSEPLSIHVITHEAAPLFEWMKNYTPQFTEFTVLDPNSTIKEWGGVWFDAKTDVETVRGALLPYNDTAIIELRLSSTQPEFSTQAKRALELVMKKLTVQP